MRVPRACLSVGFVALACLGARPHEAFALDPARRHAVVIGNAAYPQDALDNPRNDARSIAGALRGLGFEVMLIEDADKAALTALPKELPDFLGEDGVALFYYAGHAVQQRGANYLLPVDFRIAKADDLSKESLDLRVVLEAMAQTGTGLNIVVLDACRNYPFGDVGEAFGNGLANVATSGETLVAYATSAGAVALDGAGPNSPYTGALVSALELPGRDLYDVFRTVRAKVREATNGQQLPWITGSIESEFVLNDAPAPQTTPGVVLAGLDPAEVYWNAISTSPNPADYHAFAEAFPDSDYRAAAAQKAEALAAAGEQAVAALEYDAETLPSPQSRSLSVTACDRFASDPYDPRRVSPGVAWGLVNTREAIRACAEAVANDPDQPRLNFLFGRSLDIAERFAEARGFYERAAETGYPAAEYNLAFMHRTGRGVEPDDDAAALHYFDAAVGGSPRARNALAKMYQEGWGVPKSSGEMLRWLNLAADDNFPNALDHLANLYLDGDTVDKDQAKAVSLYRRAAAQNYGNALSNLGEVYEKGEGVAQDLDEAIAFYRRATDLGNPFAPYHLARLLLKTGKDASGAKDLLELSADRGYEWAYWQLARSWQKGEFGAKDPEAAAYNYLLAIEAGQSLRHPSGDLLAKEATAKLDELKAGMDPKALRHAEERAARWIDQNSLFQFSLIYPY